MESTVKREVLLEHLVRFFPSLRRYPEKYLYLFGIDSTNPPEHVAYICPLCLKNWILVEAVNGVSMNVDFSPDHYPPKSVAERLVFSVLTCKDCNSTAGTIYDHSLKSFMQASAFKKRIPNATVSVISQISKVQGRYPGRLNVDANGELEISLKPFEKLHAPFLDQFIERSKAKLDWQIELTIKTVDEKLLGKALLKAAYLLCFEAWGYEFVFSDNGNRIRQVLNGKLEYPVNLSQWIDDHIKFDQGTKVPLGLCYIQHPLECRTFIANFVLTDKDTQCRAMASVLLPNPTSAGWEDLNRVQNLFLSNSQLQIHIEHVREFFLNDRVFDGYTRSWEHLASSS